MLIHKINNIQNGTCNIRKNIIEIIGDRFYWWRKPQYTEKTTDLSQVTTLVVIGTDCTGSCKSNCDTITLYLHRDKEQTYRK
jgi:hypothetical protein